MRDVYETLTADEIFVAASHALLRRFFTYRGMNGQGKRKQLHEGSTWDDEVEGACAELALCKLRNLYWSAAAGHGVKDAGFAVDVRWVRKPHHGLIVQEGDTGWMALMDGHAPTFRAVGYFDADEAKRPEWLRKFGFVVPRELLRPFSKEELDVPQNPA